MKDDEDLNENGSRGIGKELGEGHLRERNEGTRCLIGCGRGNERC